ncbi:tyrosine-type recombinase/integrase [Streptococcus thoraltensis]|uniref:tyrosine-type recombinase/integrase n=1 Tax=Streptococcus thoraltensis TaxID=55085 RepID=UPI002A816BC6|nr:tyrosine-type recombinase/integrase [Streptococcus thoraltensis]MDY4761619.1 tyrosine-type recombinase/integrase [Streptococcus thoraltensis]
MYYRTRKNSKGETRFEIVEKYKDPLTGKWKNATVTYSNDTSRSRKDAERRLIDKIDKLVNNIEYQYNPQKIKTFGQLKQNWLETWSVSVKQQTVKREAFVLKRLGDIIGDDFLLESITPLLMKKCLSTYADRYDSSQSTLVHIKSTCNKIFNHGIMYNIIPYSPMSVVKVEVSLDKKRMAKKKHEAKFLEVHELIVFFEALSRRRNPNYYDLAIVLLCSGLRIGEAAFTREDFNPDTGVVTIDKSLQYHDLKVADFYFDTTKTINADREVALPKVACEAILRAIKRSDEFDKYALENPAKSFSHTESIFRTEYGSPITSHSFREVLARVEQELVETCEEKYGFKWTKHVTPHSFRHMHITYLQSEGTDLAMRDIMERVGHANYETTIGYTHRQTNSQEKAVNALNNFIDKNQISFTALKSWSCKYSQPINDWIEKHYESRKTNLNLDEFRNIMGIKEIYLPRHINVNILPKLLKDIKKYHSNFDIKCIREGKQKIIGYEMVW